MLQHRELYTVWIFLDFRPGGNFTFVILAELMIGGW